MGRLSNRIAALILVSLTGLVGCDLSQPGAPTPSPDTVATTTVKPSELSMKLAQYYRRVEADLLTKGLLRTDGGGPDVPFSDRNLADNFIRIALFNEYTASGGRLVARESQSRLRRWSQPIQMKIEFGDSVPFEQRSRDRTQISAYLKRLSRLTGIPMRLASSDANFNLLILNEDERRAAGPRLQQLVPTLDQTTLNTVTHLDRSTLCLVFALSDNPSTSTYSKAVAVIRGEHPELLRLSCIHEELAQGLGLANDSPAARPSIFNDDEEFGLLTYHDELLLRILYDKRLRPGMTAREARPIVRIIVAELLADTT